MNAINPVCKLIGIILPTLLLAAVHDFALNLIAFGACLLLMILSKVSFKKLLLLLSPILLVAIGMFFTGYHFQNQAIAPVNPENLKITSSAIINGLTLSSRVLAYAGLGFLFVLTTNKINLILSLRQQLKVPSIFTYGLLAAWNIFPNMLMEYNKTRAAFRARGLHPFAVSPALLKPMLVKAILWSEALSIAMESKGFNGKANRTEYYIIRLKVSDILFPIITISSLLLAILIRGSGFC